VCSYIIIVHRWGIKLDCVRICIVCMWCVVILLLGTDGILKMPVFETVLYVSSV